MAQPIPNLKAFRTLYSRENPSSTEDDVRREWATYRTQHGMSKARSPIRVTTQRYGGLTQSTLTGMPQDVVGLISGHLPASAVGVLTRTSRAGHRMTQQRMRQLCSELPTNKDVVDYLLDRLTQQLDTTVMWFKPHVGIEDGVLKVLELRYGPEFGEGIRASAVDTVITAMTDVVDNEAEDVGPRQVLESHNRIASTLAEAVLIAEGAETLGAVDPVMMLRVIRQRLGCRKNSVDYGLDMVKAYYRRVLAPYLGRLLGTEGARRVYDADYVIGELPRIVEESQDDINQLLLLSEWLEAHDLVGLSEYAHGDQPRDVDSLRGQVRGILGRIRNIDMYYAFVISDLQHEEVLEPQLPGGNEIATYLTNLIKSRHPFRVGMLNNDRKIVYVITGVGGHIQHQATKLTQVASTDYRSNNEDRSNLYVPWDGYISDEDVPTNATIDYILKTRRVIWPLDVHTLKDIINRRITGQVDLKEYLRRYLDDYVREIVKEGRLLEVYSSSTNLRDLLTPITSEYIYREHEYKHKPKQLKEAKRAVRALKIQRLGLILHKWLNTGTIEEIKAVESISKDMNEEELEAISLQLLEKVRRVYLEL